jgi:hypothetical protein
MTEPSGRQSIGLCYNPIVITGVKPFLERARRVVLDDKDKDDE